jgi:hypothetical protein
MSRQRPPESQLRQASRKQCNKVPEKGEYPRISRPRSIMSGTQASILCARRVVDASSALKYYRLRRNHVVGSAFSFSRRPVKK